MPLPPEPISIETTVNAPIENVWTCFTEPEHIQAWNNASSDWHTPRAENDLRPGGRFTYRMEARDGSQGFDFTGTYDEVVTCDHINYTLDDGRTVLVNFAKVDGATRVTETFEPEHENPLGMQRVGWQAILDAFKAHVEGH